MPKGGGNKSISGGGSDKFAGKPRGNIRQPRIPGESIRSGGMQSKPSRETINTSTGRQSKPGGEGF